MAGILSLGGRVLDLMVLLIWSAFISGLGMALIDKREPPWPIWLLGFVGLIIYGLIRMRGSWPAPRTRDPETELLAALDRWGELSPPQAARYTSLTVSEAATVLAKLTDRGHLACREEAGFLLYSVPGQARPPLRGAQAGTFEPRPSELAAAPRTLLEPPEPGATAPDAAPQSPPAAEASLSEPLSERELEVLQLLASGRSNQEIARGLYVTVGTLKSHTNKIDRKLDARNRAEALARARRLNLLPFAFLTPTSARHALMPDTAQISA